MKQLALTCLLVCVGFFLPACREKGIIGKWKRESPPLLQYDTLNQDDEMGSITFYPDSTFFMQGEKKDSLPRPYGWQTVADIKGTWSMYQSELVLRPSSVAYRKMLPYKIIKLTTDTLSIILNLPDEVPNAGTLVYSRIK